MKVKECAVRRGGGACQRADSVLGGRRVEDIFVENSASSVFLNM